MVYMMVRFLNFIEYTSNFFSIKFGGCKGEEEDGVPWRVMLLSGPRFRPPTVRTVSFFTLTLGRVLRRTYCDKQMECQRMDSLAFVLLRILTWLGSHTVKDIKRTCSATNAIMIVLRRHHIQAAIAAIQPTRSFTFSWRLHVMALPIEKQ